MVYLRFTLLSVIADKHLKLQNYYFAMISVLNMHYVVCSPLADLVPLLPESWHHSYASVRNFRLKCQCEKCA